MLSNKEITSVLKLTASLMELYEANPFKIKAFTGSVFLLEKAEVQIASLAKPAIVNLGFTDSMADKLLTIARTESLPELDELRQQTPPGIIEILSVKGLGSKKVKTIWQELKVESLHELLEACRSGKVAQLKGFGEKTQEAIIKEIDFRSANSDKLHYADAELLALDLEKRMAVSGMVKHLSLAGQIRQCAEVVDTVQLLAVPADREALRAFLADQVFLETDPLHSSPFAWRGYFREPTTGTRSVRAEVRFTDEAHFAGDLLLHSAASAHLAQAKVSRLAKSGLHTTEADIYQAAGLPYFAPELREGRFEFELVQKGMPKLLKMSDLRGILHNHSTYSDGKHTLAQMAEACRNLGYDYLGISDHSQSAFYANGLTTDRIQRQHEEIEQLNETLAPFRIFKGVESDILNDGSLDYPDAVLATFDFIVASIHSNLRMDKAKATQRLLRAIANPYTTILGHPTGRLLLRREGYPIDYEAIIEACAVHQVVIEINANPWRLDLDWRWIHHAIDQGVQISINPDAHEQGGYADMYYGLLIARKGGAAQKDVLNTLSQAEIGAYFQRKSRLVK